MDVLQRLQLRATTFNKIRDYFAKQAVLEVDTPQLSHAIGTDPHLHYFTADFSIAGGKAAETLYLQTSPEFAMKRLLAAGSGSIYQLCKAYRNGEVGPLHNPEFTLLEWYRVGFDHRDLMQDMDTFLQYVIQSHAAEYQSYQSLFEKAFDFNPHTASITHIQHKTQHLDLDHTLTDRFDKDTWLQYLLATYIEPTLGIKTPTFIYDFPASQAALARIRIDDFPVAERFEVYINGIELANGFHELRDATEQQKRFENDLAYRKKKNYPLPPIDQHFLAALPQLPACAGVALGIDRLMMIAAQTHCIQDVISFPFERC